MLSLVPDFLEKLESSFAISNVGLFNGANSKFNYIRIGLLGDVSGDDALDYLLESNSLCELVVIPSGLSFDANGEFALIVDPNRPETARIISNSDNTSFIETGVHMPLGLENIVEYLKEILEYSESKAFAVAAILKAHGCQKQEYASHFSDAEILFSTEYIENIKEIKTKAEPIEAKFEYMTHDESDTVGGYSGYLAYAISTNETWGFEPEIAILKDGGIGICSEKDSDQIDWDNIELLQENEKVSIFRSLTDIYGSYPDERLEITVALDPLLAKSWQ
tara:strand:+ start:167 stop:1000 length:834 start_codon:yes stop_codon:yes gene_type:complete